MNWGQATIGKKISVGFGVILVLLTLAGILSYLGVGGIVGNAEEDIAGNKLDATLAQKELDHLIWAEAVNSLLTQNKTSELKVQTDPHKCSFGQWLYGEGAKEAVARIPSLAPLLEEIKEPHRKLHESAIRIAGLFRVADDKLPVFFAAMEIGHMARIDKLNQALLRNMKKIPVTPKNRKCPLEKWLYSPAAGKIAAADPAMASLIKEIKESHHNLHLSLFDIQKVYKQIHPGLTELLRKTLENQHRWFQSITLSVLREDSSLGVELDPSKSPLGSFLASKRAAEFAAGYPAFKSFMTRLEEPRQRLRRSAEDIAESLGQGRFSEAGPILKNEIGPGMKKVIGLFDEAIAAEETLNAARAKALAIYQQATVPNLSRTRNLLHKLKAGAEKMLQGKKEAVRVFTEETVPALTATRNLITKIREEAHRRIISDQAMLASAQRTKNLTSLITGIALVVGILLAWFIIKGITSTLGRISDQLGEGARQVATASGQMASSGQQLAEGSSEQAASLEETASSLEQLSAQIKANAENSAAADKLMAETRQIVGRAGKSMDEMGSSMEQIAESGRETSHVISTIDEIAFQTNLLALNAAVEAARAGEAGKGFAVVADEVRALAMRAAEAARNTQAMIEETVGRINQGAELVVATETEFREVASTTSKTARLIKEIAVASEEQAEGLDQLNKAVATMDKVVQGNAATAEESASAAAQLDAQAASMQKRVEEMKMLVRGKGGAGGDTGGNRPAPSPPRKALPDKPAGGNPAGWNVHGTDGGESFQVDYLDDLDEF